MASLTPGVLLKLLQSMGTDAKVAGEHRSPVLQVVGIAPAFPSSSSAAAAGTADEDDEDGDLWLFPRGFYLQLSDSVYSTQVSLSETDADAFLSTRPQIGQLVHVDALRFAHPAPIALGLRPVPGARPRPCMGNPDPLVVRPAANRRGFAVQIASSDESSPLLVPSSAESSPFRLDCYSGEAKRTVFARKENVVGTRKSAETSTGKPRRFSSPSASKQAAGKGGGINCSPAVKASSRPSSPSLSRTSSRASSPIPSKCEVPSLVSAKEENRRVSREAAIIVPSRYRQPSPVSRKASPSPIRRRGSISPARRLSSGLKLASPLASENGGRKRAGMVIAGISRVGDKLTGSAKSVRQSWDDSSSVGAMDMKEKSVSKTKVDKESILKTQVAMLRRLSDAGGITVNTESSSDEKPRLSSKLDSELPSPIIAPQVTIYEKKWTDGSIPLDAVSNNLAKLGKEALLRRNVASLAAAEALEEALATESILRCLSMFSDICSSSMVEKPVETLDRFLSIYDDVLKYNAVLESLCSSHRGDEFKDAIATEKSRLTSLWVEAALTTDLEVLKLLDDSSQCFMKTKFQERPLLNPARTSVSKRQPSGTGIISKSHCTMNNNWTKGSYGLQETLELAKALRREMQQWFLGFAEKAMDVGFHLFGENLNDSSRLKTTTNKGNNRVAAAVLSQLKKINDWLDGIGRTPEAETLKDEIGGLKRRIYGFVVSHVGNAFDASLSL